MQEGLSYIAVQSYALVVNVVRGGRIRYNSTFSGRLFPNCKGGGLW